jgi:hypothetical protein
LKKLHGLGRPAIIDVFPAFAIRRRHLAHGATRITMGASAAEAFALRERVAVL